MVDERFQVGPEEVPADPAELVLLLDADMAPPHDVTAELLGVLGQPGRLGVVQDDDVARANVRRKCVALGGKRRLVDLVLARPERAAVTRSAIQMVVEPFGHIEEVRLSFDHEPAGVDPDAAHVSEQDVQHLGDASAGSGGVDVDHSAPVQSCERLGADDQRQLVCALRPHDLGEAVGISSTNLDVLHQASLADRASGSMDRAGNSCWRDDSLVRKPAHIGAVYCPSSFG